MNRIHFAIVLALAGSAAVAAQSPSGVLVQGKSVSAAVRGQITTNEGAKAINDATAAAVIGALASRFDGQAVQFRLGDVLSERASLRDIALHGRGEIRFDGAGEWLPIAFEAIYDTDTQSVQSPSITLGAQFIARQDASLPLGGLQAKVGKAISTEFASQQVSFDLQQASVIGSDGHRIVVEANGQAKFDGEGREDVTVQAIYDSRSRRWIDASYEFGLLASQSVIASR
ncbi:MAG: hypothetical protein M3Q51_02355 [Pseudomonadota bacterium]|nr:hypothetical protein [Pseudomonadota bacterium]MDQ3159845.1 hypothetical protein [Pseudomonadota bacterium]